MQACFVNVAAEIVRVSMAFGAQYPLLRLTLNRAPVSLNRARGVPLYNPVLALSWGPPEWVDGVHLVDLNGYPVKWHYADSYKWLVSALAGLPLTVEIVVADAAYIPKQWTDRRVEKAQLRVAIDSGTIYTAADEKITKAMQWALSDRRTELLDSAARMQEAAQWLQVAQNLESGNGIENWVTIGDDGTGNTGGGDTGGGDTGGGDTGGGT